MSCVEIIQIFGLSLNMLGVALLGFFAVPAHDLTPDGAEGLNVVVNGEEQKKRFRKYNLYRSLTFFAYVVIFLGFAIQVCSYFI